MKIAITGANGFIGENVISLLLEKKVDVIAIVRDIKKSNNIDSRCQLVKHEIGVQDDCLFAKLGETDILLHLAWGGLPNYKSLHHIDTELPKHYNFLKIMVESGVKSIAAVGTCFEYGMQSGELAEDLDARPNNPYGYAKDSLRKQLQFLQNEYDFKLTWMRLFYMYGEGQPDNTLYSQFKKAVHDNDLSFNMSGGEQLRDYLVISDVVFNIVQLVLKHRNIGVINVCNGAPISVRKLVESWSVEFNAKINLNLGFYSYPDYEPMAFWGDKSKLNRVLNK